MSELKSSERPPAAVPRAMPMLGFSSFGATHRGFTRPSNQDAFRIEPSLGVVVVVADGVSGSAGGSLASRITVDTVCDFLLEAGTPVPAADETRAQAAARCLGAALVAAHRCVREQAERTGLTKMASTITALWCTAGHAIVLHAGDTRAYRLRAGQLRQVTRDHTMVADFRRKHGTVPAQIAGFGHVVTRCLSARTDALELDTWMEPLQDGDAFVLCSDGLPLGVPDPEIAAVVSVGNDAGAVRLLIDMANAGSGYDNVTVAIARWSSTLRVRMDGDQRSSPTCSVQPCADRSVHLSVARSP
jgi:serine/threonine protein phosphatase PrpC